MNQILYSITILSVLLVACSTNPLFTPKQLENENMSLLVGVSAASGLSFYLNPIGTTYDIEFCEHNGKSLFTSWDGCPNELKITPGKHNVVIQCNVYYPSAMRSYKYNYEIIQAKPGDIYRFEAKTALLGCEISHKVTSSNQANKALNYDAQ